MEKSFVVYVNSELQYKSWRSMAPGVPLMVSLPDSVNNENQLRAFTKKVDAEILDGSYTDYTSGMVHEARLQNRAVWVDVQSKNESATAWRAALDLRLQGLQTDHPKELIEFLGLTRASMNGVLQDKGNASLGARQTQAGKLIS